MSFLRCRLFEHHIGYIEIAVRLTIIEVEIYPTMGNLVFTGLYSFCYGKFLLKLTPLRTDLQGKLLTAAAAAF